MAEVTGARSSGLAGTQPLHGREGLLLELDECVELV